MIEQLREVIDQKWSNKRGCGLQAAGTTASERLRRLLYSCMERAPWHVSSSKVITTGAFRLGWSPQDKRRAREPIPPPTDCPINDPIRAKLARVSPGAYNH